MSDLFSQMKVNFIIQIIEVHTFIQKFNTCDEGEKISHLNCSVTIALVSSR